MKNAVYVIVCIILLLFLLFLFIGRERCHAAGGTPGNLPAVSPAVGRPVAGGGFITLSAG